MLNLPHQTWLWLRGTVRCIFVRVAHKDIGFITLIGGKRFFQWNPLLRHGESQFQPTTSNDWLWPISHYKDLILCVRFLLRCGIYL